MCNVCKQPPKENKKKDANKIRSTWGEEDEGTLNGGNRL
jgi:hypothetical protein